MNPINLVLVPIRFVVAILVCLGIFLFSLVTGALEIPKDVLIYTFRDASIAFRQFHINFPQLKRKPVKNFAFPEVVYERK
jgi:hypothetical protein